MPRIPSCSRIELIKKLKKLGFEGPFPGGKHGYMKKDKFRLTIPNPHGKQIDSNFIKELLRQAGISAEEWLKS